MKKILCSIFIASGCHSLAAAQSKNNIEFGAGVGYNSANISTGFLGSNTISGFNAGVYADKYFSDRWSIKIKLIYDEKGYTDPSYHIDAYNFLGATYAATNTVAYNYPINYITVPIMANWHFGRKRNWYLNFGLYIGFLTSAKETPDNVDEKNMYNSIDAGLALGIGIKFKIGNKLKLFIEQDNQSGVTNIYKQNYGSDTQNSRSSINVGLNF